MKGLLLALVLSLSSPAPAQDTDKKPAQGDAEQEILKLQDEMEGAMGGADFTHYDLAAADRLVADDAVLIGPDGASFTKAQVFGGMRERAAAIKEAKGVTGRDKAEVSNKRAHVFGDTAVVTTDVHFVDQVKEGTARWDATTTSVWARRGGRWQLVLNNTVRKGQAK